MGFLQGKKLLITGVLSNRSIAYGIARACHREGAELAFTYVGERFHDRIVEFAKEFGSDICLEMDVTKDDQIANVMGELKERWGGLDGFVHSIGFAPRECIAGDYLDGIGREKKEGTPFNVDWNDDKDQIESARGYTYAIVKYTDGLAILSVTNLDASTAFVYALEDTDISDGWSSIAANPGAHDSGSLTPIAISTSNATASALYYKEGDTLYYIYLGSDNAITRVEVSADASDLDYVRETTYLARSQSGATLLYLDDGYLYFSKAGTNGNALWRIRYDGSKSDYVSFGNESETPEEYKPTQYLQIDYNDSWFAPEVVGGYLFFSNAEEYAENYVYAFNNGRTNAELETLNDLYDEVQDTFTSVAADFSEAADVLEYYYYVGNIDVLDEEKHSSEYEEEDLEVIDGFIACSGDVHGFDFTVLKDEAGTAANVQSYFYGRIGMLSEADEETINDALVADLILTDPDAEE